MKKKSMPEEPDKLTIADMRSVEAAYERGEKYTMERLGDGALRLRKGGISAKDHDQIESDLQQWLANDDFGLRAPGVRDNLFRLSDYLSGRSPLPPPYEVLLFLHAYIFALECRIYYDKQELNKRKPDIQRFPRKTYRKLMGGA